VKSIGVLIYTMAGFCAILLGATNASDPTAFGACNAAGILLLILAHLKESSDTTR